VRRQKCGVSPTTRWNERLTHESELLESSAPLSKIAREFVTSCSAKWLARTNAELIVERAEIVWKALRIFQTSNVDFADCLIERSAAAAGCERTMTFDRSAAKNAGITLLA
jgi:predicted nucleic-acid-binding protein